MNVTALGTGAGPGQRSGAVAGGSRLGKQEFLTLLITELRYQNPMEPMDTSEYMAQLAQFGTMEEIQNLGRLAARSYSASLLGRRVTAADSGGDTVTGTVVGVREAPDGSTRVRVQDGSREVEVDLGSIREITAAP
ncbi:flagellar hook assembly protein FlgD [Caldinitratiruptor microaerophilus]|uniref:Flagellar basal-body rod modification protein FlgD n=1 Tax=Caldinitratiruptor microaerophilus TaxID=671077 RepID=A0AA35G5G3_9FIRM|nr:flagellar hook capping FlgD N-terminal domain-containing protein [Caldinitratiruptor microaerophilus]BDG59356.1 hypothetical protein caldi_04460 [Caldinitratiruptor microaerophilus]